MTAQRDRLKCLCGQPWIFTGPPPGYTGAYCAHCDKPHDSWTANKVCVACQLYAQNTTRT